MTTYWHIAHPTYTSGNLICRDQLEAAGLAPEWKWAEMDEGFDGHVVCMFPDTPRGRTEADWLWYEHPDYHLIQIDLPDDHPITEVEEGYPACVGQIPVDYLTRVCTGYAEGVVTRDGDEY